MPADHQWLWLGQVPSPAWPAFFASSFLRVVPETLMPASFFKTARATAKTAGSRRCLRFHLRSTWRDVTTVPVRGLVLAPKVRNPHGTRRPGLARLLQEVSSRGLWTLARASVALPITAPLSGTCFYPIGPCHVQGQAPFLEGLLCGRSYASPLASAMGVRHCPLSVH